MVPSNGESTKGRAEHTEGADRTSDPMAVSSRTVADPLTRGPSGLDTFLFGPSEYRHSSDEAARLYAAIKSRLSKEEQVAFARFACF